MRLIEQLGGYEKAKGVYKSVDHLRETKTITMSNISVEFDVGVLRCELLEYRRENNIFEVGDSVVNSRDGDDKNIYTIRELYSKFIVGDNGSNRGFWTLFYPEIRHANLEEIQEGRRL